MARSLVQPVIEATGMSVAKTDDGRGEVRRTPYRTGEFARVLRQNGYRVSASTVVRWCNEGKVDFKRTSEPNGDRLIYARELTRILAEHRAGEGC
jgi:hypothetical protein